MNQTPTIKFISIFSSWSFVFFVAIFMAGKVFRKGFPFLLTIRDEGFRYLKKEK